MWYLVDAFFPLGRIARFKKARHSGVILAGIHLEVSSKVGPNS